MRQMSSAVRLTEGGIRPAMLRFAVPLFLSQLFQQLYNSVDTLIVGRFLGTEALGAVGSSGNLIFLITSFLIGIMEGAGVIISKNFGADEPEKVRRSVHTAVLGSLYAGIFITVIGAVFSPVFLRWMGTDEAVMPYSVLYFRVYFLGSLSVAMYNACRVVMTSLGDSRRPLIYLGISSALNVVLDLLFVAVLRFGVGSAALATVISQTVSFLLALRHLREKSFPFRLERRELHITGSILRDMLRCGVPTGVQNSVIGFANVLVQTNINSFGSAAMAACGTYSKIEGFVFLPISAFSMVNTTFVSQNLGARQYDRAKEGAWFGIITATLAAEVIGLVMILFAEQCIGLFTDDPAVIAIGLRQIRIEAWFYFLLSFDHGVAGVCRGAGKATVPMGIMLGIWCVLRISYITAMMSFRHEIHLLFWAYPLTWGISSVMFLLYYLRSDWVHGLEHEI